MNPNEVIWADPLIVPAGTELLSDTNPNEVICAEPLSIPLGTEVKSV